MSALTNAFENKLVDFLFRGQALGLANSTAAAGTGPTSIYIGLLTAAPTDSTGGTEVTGGNYARLQVASTLAVWNGTGVGAGFGSGVVSAGDNGTISNAAVLTMATPSAAWGVVAAVGAYDSLTGGTLLYWGLVTGGSKTIGATDPAPTFAINALAFQIDN